MITLKTTHNKWSSSLDYKWKSALRLTSNYKRPRRQRPTVSLIRADKANSTRTPTPCPGPPTNRGFGPVPFIETIHKHRLLFFIPLNFNRRPVKSPIYPPKAEPRAMPHLPSTKKRTESAQARPTSLQHPPRKSGGVGAFMCSGLRLTERDARSANRPDMATHRRRRDKS